MWPQCARVVHVLARRGLSSYRRRVLLSPSAVSALFTNARPSARRILFRMSNDSPPHVVGYYVVFPVIPDETVENNTFLANIAANTDWPTITSSSPKEMYEGTVRLIMEYGATVMEHLDRLKTVKEDERTFAGVIEPLLREEYDMNYAFFTLFVKMLTDWPLCSKQEFNADLFHVKAMCSREQMEKLLDPEFQDSVKLLYDKRAELDDWTARLVEYYLLEIRAGGLHIRDAKTRKLLTSWSKFCEEYRSKYLSCIIATNDQNQFTVTDRNILKDAPPHVLRLLATDRCEYEKGPWKARMSPTTIMPFLQYCGDQHLRETAWTKWISRASFEHDFYNNSVNVEEIRHNNEGWAKTLGYSSVSSHRLRNKMAGTPDTVRNFIKTLKDRMQPVFFDRFEMWSSFAKAEGFFHHLFPYDLFYYCRREAEQSYDVEPLDLMNHFPFWSTFDNLTELFARIFNLNFKDITESGLERCHSDIRIYSVDDLSSNTHLGRLYVDPFERPNKRADWCAVLGRTANEARGFDKLVYLIGAADAPTSESPSLLHYSELQKLLFNMGRAMQLLFSQSPYWDITIPWEPFLAADWDAADLLPAFTQFFIYKPDLLRVLASKHLKTGEMLSVARADTVSVGLTRGMLWESYRVLFWSDFDLTIFEMEDRKKKFWLDVYRDMYRDYFHFKMSRSDYHPCSFTPIFGSQPHMGMYYRKLWTEMLALDVHDTFDVEGDVGVTGERLKDTVLKTGGGDMQSELYRRFQGRDPSIGAICDFYDRPSYFDHRPYVDPEDTVRVQSSDSS